MKLGGAALCAFVSVLAASACGPRTRPVAETGHGTAPLAAHAEEPAGDDDTGSAPDHDGEVEAEDVAAADERCPEGMVVVESGERAWCIDRYEASLVEVMPDGSEQPYPHYKPVDGHTVRAVSVAGVYPQGFISEVQAQDACAASNKRLCTYPEWKTACMGPDSTAFPYGNTRQAGVCHDQGKSAVLAVFGAKAVLASTPLTPGNVVAPPSAHAPPGKKTSKKTAAKKSSTKPTTTKTATKSGTRSATKATRALAAKASKKGIAGRPSTRPSNVDPGVWAKLNEPALGQVDGALAKTGEHEACTNAYGVFDIVGNLHEWVATDASLPHGTFAGGYYLDTALNGDGCHYRTVAHAHDYHDYSTGFRCCADVKDE